VVNDCASPLHWTRGGPSLPQSTLADPCCLTDPRGLAKVKYTCLLNLTTNSLRLAEATDYGGMVVGCPPSYSTADWRLRPYSTGWVMGKPTAKRDCPEYYRRMPR
jgi:hypothetical protein